MKLQKFYHQVFIRSLAPIALLLGFIAGTSVSVAASGNFFAGYEYSIVSNKGVEGSLPFDNPNVPSTVGEFDFSTEWVMAAVASVGYVQAGWLKYRIDTSGPQYFFEYDNGCGSFCRFRYGTINSTSHRYTVQVVSSGTATNWCGFIDGTQKDCGSSSTIGFATASRAIYSGETTETSIHLGGTASSPFRMYRLNYLNTNGSWYGVNTTQMVSVTSSGTRYRASVGYDTTTYVKNWTEF